MRPRGFARRPRCRRPTAPRGQRRRESPRRSRHRRGPRRRHPQEHSQRPRPKTPRAKTIASSRRRSDDIDRAPRARCSGRACRWQAATPTSTAAPRRQAKLPPPHRLRAPRPAPRRLWDIRSRQAAGHRLISTPPRASRGRRRRDPSGSSRPQRWRTARDRRGNTRRSGRTSR